MNFNKDGGKMKRLFLLVVMGLFLTGCTAKYETIQHKDISLKVRSAIVDIDYESRVALNPGELKPMEPLPELKGSNTKPIKPLE